MKFNSKLTNNDLEVFIEVLPEGRSMKNVLRELLAARKVVEESENIIAAAVRQIEAIKRAGWVESPAYRDEMNLFLASTREEHRPALRNYDEVTR